MTIVRIIRDHGVAAGDSGSLVTPSFVANMTIGTWYDISGASPDLSLSATNLADDIDPDPTLAEDYSGSVGFRGIMDAWNSGVFCPDLGASGSMLYYGGGHGDFFGNCIIRFDIASRTWSMLFPPSEAGPFDGSTLTNGAYIDGTPSPPHTYQYLQYDPVSKSLVCIKAIDHVGASQSEPISTWALPWMFSVVDMEWRRGPNNTNTSSPSDGLMCYDSTRLGFWHCNHNNGVFTLYSPAGDNGDGTFGSWGSVLDSPNVYNSDCGMGLDPTTDSILFMDFIAGALYLKDPDNMAASRVTVTQSGKPTTPKQSSWEWCPRLGGFLCMLADTGNLYLVTSSNGWSNATWTLLTVATNGKDFTTDNGQIFNRIRVIEYGDSEDDPVVCVFTNKVSSPAKSIRLQ